ncbi:MAG: carboxypeptidase-like regulatory domain-containing protein, partial [Candidatus Aminicenantes bacterium]|nr:carboxypeptidase-like regulatory domain-containing protein [Candidatus Aminicenantes bacterium]
MNKKIFHVVLILGLALALTSMGYAQRQTGSLHGQVIDKDKIPLPGATVSISGAALMGKKDYVTPENGAFRFPTLLPGEYELRTEMPNFKTKILKGILVGVGKTTEVTIELEIATVAEEVTVVAQTPVVDIKASKMNVNFTAQFLASIPMNRDLYDIQNSIPGSVAEGIDYRRMSSILGGTLRSQLYALDGVPMNDPAVNYSMANINVDVYDEIEFEMGAHPAEVGQTDSTYINIVTKSGGNKLSGGGVFYYTQKSLGENLIAPEQIRALKVNPPEKFLDYKDFSLNLGGPIIKDRLWFFLNGRRQVSLQANPNTPEMRMATAGFTDPTKLKHYDVEHQEWLGFGKLTFQITKNIRYMGMLHYNHIHEPVYQNSLGVDASYEYVRIWDHENTYTTTHQFNIVLDQN